MDADIIRASMIACKRQAEANGGWGFWNGPLAGKGMTYVGARELKDTNMTYTGAREVMEYKEGYITPIEVGVLLGQMRSMFPEQADRIYNYIEMLHDLLEEADGEDAFGTQGWRYRYE
jgi:hypothetical protein